MPTDTSEGANTAAALKASGLRHKLRLYARRDGIARGRACHADWENEIRLLLLARIRNEDDGWLAERERLSERWEKGRKDRVRGLPNFLKRDEVRPWLDTALVAEWIDEEGKKEMSASCSGRPMKERQRDEAVDSGPILKEVQAAYLGGLLDGMKARGLATSPTEKPAEEQ